METVIDFDSYISILCEDYDGTEDIYEYACTAADNSEYAIYNYKAWELVNHMHRWDYSRIEEAEEDLNYGGYDFADMNSLMCAMSYCILKNAIYEAINDRINTKRARGE